MRVRIIEVVIAARSTIEIVEVGVVNVDPTVVSIAAVIPRMERLSPTQWEPTKSKSEAKSKSAQPSYIRRSIKR
jgi:hypothetical protein